MNDSWDAVDQIHEGASRFKAELLDYDIRRLNSVGPISYQGYLYTLVRAEEPSIVIETGVRSGVSTTLILAALERNGAGALHSCDPCYQSTDHAIKAIEAATGMGDRVPWERWDFDPRKSEVALEVFPYEIDMFIHDSDHSWVNMAFELEAAWEVLLPEGLLICDDWKTCVGAEKHTEFENFVNHHKVDFYAIGSAAVVRKPGEAL